MIRIKISHSKNKQFLLFAIFFLIIKIILMKDVTIYAITTAFADDQLMVHIAEKLLRLNWLGGYNHYTLAKGCNGVQREHNKKLNNGLPILHKVPPKRDYGRYFCIMAEKGGTSHGGLTEKLSPFFHAKKQEVNAYGR